MKSARSLRIPTWTARSASGFVRLSLPSIGGASLRLHVPNFSKYNPRADVKNPTWIRLERDWWMDPKLEGSGPVAKLVWPFILSKANFETCIAEFSVTVAVAALEISQHDLDAALEELKQRNMVTCLDDVTDTYARVRTRTDAGVTDVRNVTNGTDGTDVLSLPSKLRKKKSLPPPPSEADLAVGREWLAFALHEMPWQAGRRGFSDESFAQAVAELRRATDLNPEGVAAVLAFVKADDFWRRNALSPAGLLKRSAKNGNRKIDNILVRMKTPTDRVLDSLKEWAEAT